MIRENGTPSEKKFLKGEPRASLDIAEMATIHSRPTADVCENRAMHPVLGNDFLLEQGCETDAYYECSLPTDS